MQVGVESTIVSCLGEPTLLRPGGVPRDAIERVLGRPLTIASTDAKTPARAGHAGLALRAEGSAAARRRGRSAGRGAARLRSGACLFPARYVNLSPRGDLIEAAANLFSHLRALDASGAKRIAVMQVPHDGLGEAINDRLKRAAAPRRYSQE